MQFKSAVTSRINKANILESISAADDFSSQNAFKSSTYDK